MAYIFLLSHVLRLLNVEHVAWVGGLSWFMVLQVAVSQIFVWVAILTGRLDFYVYEGLGWALIFVANTRSPGWYAFRGGRAGGRALSR